MARVERSAEAYVFNNALVTIIERELPTQPFGSELRAVLLEPLSASTCGEKPEFFISFESAAESRNP